MSRKLPVIGAWYQDIEENQIFEVVALDEDGDCIDIQYADGEIGEFDYDTWHQMLVLPAQPPEDWSAPYELAKEDSVDPDKAFTTAPVDDPLRDIEPESVFSGDDY